MKPPNQSTEMVSAHKQYNKGSFDLRKPIIWALVWLFAHSIVVVRSNETEPSEQQVADRSVYPDYCWFDGLENRILVEYPDMYEQIKLHDAALYKEKNYPKAADLHREIFKRIYELELANLASANAEDAESGSSGDPPIDDHEHRAAYKLFDLWANTPGDFESKNEEYNNYLEPYLIESHIEFWSYCLDDRADCHTILSQLMVLAKDQELGPIELLQVSANMIMLMNSHKADLVLEKLTSRQVINLNGLKKTDNDDEEATYERMLNNIVKLIETDENFNEAAFQYVFTITDEIHKIIDPKIESYFMHEIAKFNTDNEHQ